MEGKMFVAILKLNNLEMYTAASFLFPFFTLCCLFALIALGAKQKPVLRSTTTTEKEKQRHKRLFKKYKVSLKKSLPEFSFHEEHEKIKERNLTAKELLPLNSCCH